MKFWDIVGTLRSFKPVVYMMFRSGRYSPLTLPLNYEVVEKRLRHVVLGPEFLGEDETPNFGHAFSNVAHFRTCGRFWLSSVQ